MEHINPIQEKIKKLSELNSLRGAITVTKINDLKQDYEQAFIFLPLLAEINQEDETKKRACNLISHIEKEGKEIILVECDCCFPDVEIRGEIKNRFWILKASYFLLALSLGRTWINKVYPPGFVYYEELNPLYHYNDKDKFNLLFGFPAMTKEQLEKLLLYHAPDLSNYFREEKLLLEEVLALNPKRK